MSSVKSLPKAEHVGSFLRPKEVLEARAANQSGKLSDAELRKVEDKHIAELVKQQIDNGIYSISDGEYRRGLSNHIIIRKAMKLKH